MVVETNILYMKGKGDTPASFTSRVMTAADETLETCDKVTITYWGNEESGITFALVTGEKTAYTSEDRRF